MRHSCLSLCLTNIIYKQPFCLFKIDNERGRANLHHFSCTSWRHWSTSPRRTPCLPGWGRASPGLTPETVVVTVVGVVVVTSGQGDLSQIMVMDCFLPASIECLTIKISEDLLCILTPETFCMQQNVLPPVQTYLVLVQLSNILDVFEFYISICHPCMI